MNYVDGLVHRGLHLSPPVKQLLRGKVMTAREVRLHVDNRIEVSAVRNVDHQSAEMRVLNLEITMEEEAWHIRETNGCDMTSVHLVLRSQRARGHVHDDRAG